MAGLSNLLPESLQCRIPNNSSFGWSSALLAGNLVGRLVTFKKEGLGRWTNLGVGMVGALIGGLIFQAWVLSASKWSRSQTSRLRSRIWSRPSSARCCLSLSGGWWPKSGPRSSMANSLNGPITGVPDNFRLRIDAAHGFELRSIPAGRRARRRKYLRARLGRHRRTVAAGGAERGAGKPCLAVECYTGVDERRVLAEFAGPARSGIGGAGGRGDVAARRDRSRWSRRSWAATTRCSACLAA